MKFSAQHLRRLLKLNAFPIVETDWLVFGIRGASPADADYATFRPSHEIIETPVDYQKSCCILGIWNPTNDTLALFKGSTVPHISSLRVQLARIDKEHANAMMSGYYNFYQKGIHKEDQPSGHEALRLQTEVVFRRSLNNLIIDNNDEVDIKNVFDNIHAAYCDTPNGVYSSAGCQVIVGQPKCLKRNNQPNTGDWAKFHDFIYGIPQQRFDYCLFRFADAKVVVENQNTPLQVRIRVGSRGDLVRQLQDKLIEKGYLTLNRPENFAKKTVKAVLKFQTDQFGKAEADGVVGIKTATKLGIALPTIL